MKLKLLNKEELTDLYYNEMIYTFPKSELKPLSGMLRLMDMGRYEPLLAMENGEAVGYALMWPTGDRTGALLEYLGVFRGKRNSGRGSRILSCVCETYGQLVGEAEAPDSAEENDLRSRRLGFYLRNGFRVLDYECALFGVHFNCIYWGPEKDEEEILKMHQEIYAGYFSHEHRDRYIQLPLKPGEVIHPAPEWIEETEPEQSQESVIG